MSDQSGRPVRSTVRPMSGTPVVRDLSRQAAQSRELAEFKRHARASWATGDYASVAASDLWPLGERVIAHAAVRPGEDVLDVACGTGNAAIRAAQARGRAVGVDLTPELFEAGRRLAAEAGVEVEWVEGDAEALPFGDESFDVVVSVNGVMFAPRHQAAARDMARVLRPGGRMVLYNFEAGSVQSQILRTIGRYLPPPPAPASPPWLWGNEDHIRGLFAGTGITLECARERLESARPGSADEAVDFYTTRLGPLITARAATEADGRWPMLHDELVPLHERVATADYLVVRGRKRTTGAV